MGGVFASPNLALYSYTHQNPVKFVDPDGNEPGVPDFTAYGAAGGTVIGAVIGGAGGGTLGLGCGPAAVACSPAAGTAGATAGAAAGLYVGTVIGAGFDLAEDFFHWAGNMFNESSEGDDSSGSGSKGRTSEEEALNDIIKDLTNDGRKPLSSDDADAALELGDELGLGTRDDRGEKGDKKGEGQNHWEGGDHIHIEKIRVRKGGSHIKADPPPEG